MKRLAPGLYIVGLGIPEKVAASVEAVDALRRSDVVFSANPDDGFFRSLCRDVRVFGPIGPGSAATRSAAKEIAAHARGKAVAFAIYGHPLVYEPIVAELLHAAKKLGVESRIVPGVSAVDAALALLKISLRPGSGLQIGDAVFFLSRGPAPDCAVFIYKAGMTADRLPALLARLTKARGKTAKVAIVEGSNFGREGAGARWTTLGELASEDLPYYSSLFLP